ncbi:transposase, Ptta/En/Spm, partial [Tanacetum coccineum]
MYPIILTVCRHLQRSSHRCRSSSPIILTVYRHLQRSSRRHQSPHRLLVNLPISEGASNPTEASSFQVSHQQHPSHQIIVATSSEATTDTAPSDSGLPKKVRGPTRKQAIWDMVNDRIVVNLDETGQPVGDEGNEFTNFLGTLVKMPQHVSLKCRDWRKLSQDKKADLWSIVKEITLDISLRKKFEINNVQGKSFLLHLLKQSRFASGPCSKSNEPHVTGTKSFARITHEETQKNGDAPSRGGLYCITRIRKDGSIASAAASGVI